MFRRCSAVAVVAISLVACSSERAAVVSYVEEAQSLAERMVEEGASFETLMNVQDDPLAWSESAKNELADTLEAFRSMRADAASMSVPPAFTETHPLLVQSFDRMIAAIEVIDSIASDPSTATPALAADMEAKAIDGERLANDYVTGIEQILTATFPEMIEE